eukprot:7380696-Prymnesium_polylepis.2
MLVMSGIMRSANNALSMTSGSHCDTQRRRTGGETGESGFGTHFDVLIKVRAEAALVCTCARRTFSSVRIDVFAASAKINVLRHEEGEDTRSEACHAFRLEGVAWARGFGTQRVSLTVRCSTA